jgi:hypothetical protein
LQHSRLALEGKIDARHLIEIVEHHQCCVGVDQRDPAGLQPAVLRPARQQAEELFLTNQFEFSAHDCMISEGCILNESDYGRMQQDILRVHVG